MKLLTRSGDLQVIYNSYLAIACNVPNAFFVILTALLGHKFNTKLQVWLSPTQLFYTLTRGGILCVPTVLTSKLRNSTIRKMCKGSTFMTSVCSFIPFWLTSKKAFYTWSLCTQGCQLQGQGTRNTAGNMRIKAVLAAPNTNGLN